MRTERGERVIVLAKGFEVYEGWIRKCHIIQNLNSQVWTELKLFQDSNRYRLAKSAEAVVTIGSSSVDRNRI